MSKIKILVIVDNLNKCDGIASYVMNYYKCINNDRFQFDFLISKFSHDNVHDEYLNLIKLKKDRIIYRNNKASIQIIKEILGIKRFFKENKYDIVHCHILNMGFFYLWNAKRAGVKVRILHSHTTYLWSKNIVKKIRNNFFKYMTVKSANIYFACSNLAGKYMFANKEYVLVKNAIFVDNYTFNMKKRNDYRNKLNINDKTVIGHIGRFNIQKNHIFLLEIFDYLSKIKDNMILLLIGKGELETTIKEEIIKRDLTNKVIFLGERDDINYLLQAIDIFLLPSFFEGLPVVGIEAQAADVPCIFSDRITKEIKLLDKSILLPINNYKLWVDAILEICQKKVERRDVMDVMKLNGYEINTASIELENLYIKLIDEKY